jgi:Fic family protein
MNRSTTGRYEITTTAGEKVRAFIPSPLPPEPPLDLTGTRQRLLERAQIAIGRLDAITELLPDPHLFLYSYVRREAVLSSQIEGTQSSLSDLLLYELADAPGTPLDDVLEVSNYIAALQHGIDRMKDGFPLSNRLLREMHQKLMASGRGADKQPGEFRRSQNWIGGTRPGNAKFVPPPPFEVENGMGDLERFIHNDEDGLPVLVKAALAHVQFETIHPFLDGNGRLGRLLIVLILHHNGILREPLLYLSLYLKKYRHVYYSLLDEVRRTGDWEAWLEFFLTGVEETAANAVNTARRLVTLFETDAKNVQQIGRSAANALRVFNELKQRPVLNIAHLTETLNLSFPTAASVLQKLIDTGIVTELTGQQRNRVFVYQNYLNILNEGGEPL